MKILLCGCFLRHHSLHHLGWRQTRQKLKNISHMEKVGNLMSNNLRYLNLNSKMCTTHVKKKYLDSKIKRKHGFNFSVHLSLKQFEKHFGHSLFAKFEIEQKAFCLQFAMNIKYITRSTRVAHVDLSLLTFTVWRGWAPCVLVRLQVIYTLPSPDMKT